MRNQSGAEWFCPPLFLSSLNSDGRVISLPESRLLVRVQYKYDSSIPKFQPNQVAQKTSCLRDNCWFSSPILLVCSAKKNSLNAATYQKKKEKRLPACLKTPSWSSIQSYLKKTDRLLAHVGYWGCHRSGWSFPSCNIIVEKNTSAILAQEMVPPMFVLSILLHVCFWIANLWL